MSYDVFGLASDSVSIDTANLDASLKTKLRFMTVASFEKDTNLIFNTSITGDYRYFHFANRGQGAVITGHSGSDFSLEPSKRTPCWLYW